MEVGGNRQKSVQLSEAVRADREWERQCGDLARLASDWLWEMDADLLISYISDRLRWIMDVDPAFFIGKSRNEYMDPSTDSAELAAHLEDLRAHRSIRGYVYDIETPSGQRYVKIDGDPVFDEHGGFQGYRGIGTQVTDQVRAQQKAEQSFQQLVDAVESLPVGLAQYDRDDRLLFWNGSYTRLYPWLVPVLDCGVSFERIIRQLSEAGGYSDAIKSKDEWVELSLAARKIGGKPFEIALSDGRWILVSYHRTNSGGIISIHTDISRIKEEEEALRQSEQRFVRAFQFSPGTTAIAEIDDGTLIDINEKWQETFGWTRDEVIGKSALDLGIWAEEADRRQFIELLRGKWPCQEFRGASVRPRWQCPGYVGIWRNRTFGRKTTPADYRPRHYGTQTRRTETAQQRSQVVGYPEDIAGSRDRNGWRTAHHAIQ